MNSKSSTTIYAVRHGETEWNREGRAQGHLDSPLTNIGRKQAELLAEGLVDKGIDVIITSDLGRALATCRAIAERLGIEFEVEPGLRERNLGTFQGLTHAEFAEQHPEHYASYKDARDDSPIPGGESRGQHLKRSIAAAQHHIARHCGETVLFVCHGGVLDCFLNYTLGLRPGPKRRYSILNSSVNHFEVTDGEWKLITWGDVSHLRGLEVLDEPGSQPRASLPRS